ncbi:MAG: DNA helicase RecQ [Firmicutes bacterium]|nr:DNA helicase RecQ [Bacillota bacterium]MCL2256455.1 DNA helicase RecQ [Bacillota bacterium]
MKKELLKQYFGHENFRSGQEKLVDSVLHGRDCLGVMPTGAGKSVCYQLPAMMNEGVTIVVSPLISLMKDQVGALRENGISAAYINSSLTIAQTKKALDFAKEGKYKIIYVAPERLDMDSFVSFAQNVNIFMLTVDEAHCVSEWGQDFRPHYRKISTFIEKLHRRPIVSAFTATATTEVCDDIVRLLKLKSPEVVVTGFNRENLYFEVKKPKKKYLEILDYVKKNKDKSGIIYCSTRDNVEDISKRLIEDGFGATRYHAGLSDLERAKNQDDFLCDKKQIMVATNAFGMGIDKSNVSFVIHNNMPKNIEAYYQEAGRAGRDGTSADCIMLYGDKDVQTIKFFIENTNEKNDLNSDMIEKVRQNDREKLQQIKEYCHTTECLRKTILEYFNDNCGAIDEYCGNCSNCKDEFVEQDVTEIAQKILSCVSRIRGKFGMTVAIDTLRGSKNAKVLNFKLNEIKTYGALKDISEKRVKDIFNFLIEKKYLACSTDKFPTIYIQQKAHDVLFEGEKIKMKLPIDYAKREKELTSNRSQKHLTPLYNINTELFIKLKELRAKLANEQKVPAFVVFSDLSLIDMCNKMPLNENEFLNVSGVGAFKLEKYCGAFLDVLSQFQHLKEFQVERKKVGIEELINLIKNEFKVKNSDVYLAELADQILFMVKEKLALDIKSKPIRDAIKKFFQDKGLIEIEKAGNENKIIPTKKGLENGIVTQERVGKLGKPYTQVLYAQETQQLLIDNIEIIFLDIDLY